MTVLRLILPQCIYPGKVIERGTKEFDDLMNPECTHPQADDSINCFPTPRILPGARAIIWLDIIRVGTSCGYAVPFMTFESHRASPPSSRSLAIQLRDN